MASLLYNYNCQTLMHSIARAHLNIVTPLNLAHLAGQAGRFLVIVCVQQCDYRTRVHDCILEL
jgi:hypothetical protein